MTGEKTLRGRRNGDDAVFYGTMPPVMHMLDWLIRQYPDNVRHAVGSIMGKLSVRLASP